MRRETVDLRELAPSALTYEIHERIAKAEGADWVGAHGSGRYPRLVVGVDEQTIEVAGAPVFYRHAPATGPTVVYLHSVPTSSDDWVAFLERSGGIAPDLLGFGRSGKGGHLVYTLPAYVDFLETLLQMLDVESMVLVGHGWGAAIGLMFAQRHVERIERLVIIDAVPLLAGFQWPRLARRWRLPVVGELLMGSVNQWLLARLLRAGTVTPEAWSQERIAAVWEQFDQGTQRAILRLHRSIDPAGLAAAGAGLPDLSAPALVIWGDRDPWLSSSLADAYAQRLPHAQLEHVAQAGHWPWLDQPDVVQRVTAFVNQD